MSTFGNVTLTTDWYTANYADFKFAQRFQLTEDGDVSKLSIEIDNLGTGNGACYAMGVIYDDSSTQPNALKGTSAAVAISAAQAKGVVDFTFASAVSLAAGYYWLGLIGDANADGVRIQYDSTNPITSGDSCYAADTYSGGAADPFGAHTDVTYNARISGTYTSGPAAPVLAASQHAGGVAHIDLSWT